MLFSLKSCILFVLFLIYTYVIDCCVDSFYNRCTKTQVRPSDRTSNCRVRKPSADRSLHENFDSLVKNRITKNPHAGNL